MARIRRFARKPRFRRKNRGTWFPIEGATWQSEGELYGAAGIELLTGAVGEDKAAGATVITGPVTADYTFDRTAASGFNLEQQPSLRDYVQGQDYILKSLVGNVFVGVEPSGNTTTFDPTAWWTYLLIGFGFFVARANDADQTLPDLTGNEIDPLASTNIQNSWIFRRTWILANPANLILLSGGDVAFSDEISTNRTLDSVSGPFFKTKSRRRIRREERLWYALSAIGWDAQRASVNGGTGGAQPNVSGHLDVRLFGTMVKGRNQSTF